VVVEGSPAFAVSGTGERLALTAPARQVGDDWQLSVDSIGQRLRGENAYRMHITANVPVSQF